LRVLAFYGEARSSGVLPADALNTSDPEDDWNALVQGSIAMASVSARHYLAGQDSLQNSGFAALPGWAGPAAPVGRGWALAIITKDPERRQAAAELIAWLASSEREGPWAQAAGWLPAGPKGWSTWKASSYRDFLQLQLAIAVNRPVGSGYPLVAAQLHKAVVTVLKDGVSPQQATEAALKAIQTK
jgi:ABC-type glycerol-3-phosphate transport system substrate-binding protein